ncbi:AraC family transcriptional regulator [Providencia sp. 21OH12SH02B-Prov]|uniref:AraC family transcriptional regulator n=1 Tax=unclassified Providencia TaxID=2633465 RepID=UPI0022B6A905|nr:MULTISPECIES: AraC family transcriptional regulator [unclassified Providencia]WBA57522.1 AraC family transcriptional regulator [Providencia sp. 21OH12SH02B-Prov]
MLLPELHYRQYSEDVVSHQHDGQWQIVFALAGGMEINMHRQHFLLGVGNGVIIAPGVSHAFSGQTGNQNYVLEMPIASQWRFDEKTPYFSLTPAAMGLLNWLQNFPQPPEQNTVIAKLLLAQLKPQSQWIDSITQWVDARLHRPISCQDMANAFCMSVSTLQRKIKVETQLTVMQFVLQQRMEAACRLLMGTLSIEQVALAVGYDSHSAFSQAFRQFYGKTPMEYRLGR